MSIGIRFSDHTYALDCPDARTLADFYAKLLGWETSPGDGYPSWVNVTPPAGEHPGFSIGCQQIENYRAPEWPAGPIPQQAHIDFYVSSLSEAVPLAEAAGAKKHPHQPSENGGFVVFLDPAGHPFCLCAETPAQTSA